MYEVTNSCFVGTNSHDSPSRTLEQWLFITSVGTRTWKDVDWDGRGHRSIINTDLGTICRYMYPVMVSMGGLLHAARSRED
jgi:hypothetical protein